MMETPEKKSRFNEKDAEKLIRKTIGSNAFERSDYRPAYYKERDRLREERDAAIGRLEKAKKDLDFFNAELRKAEAVIDKHRKEEKEAKDKNVKSEEETEEEEVDKEQLAA